MALPWVTVAINVVSSFLLGMLVVAHWASPQTRAALEVGFLGGFTTFSTWTVQAFLDADTGQVVRGMVLIFSLWCSGSRRPPPVYTRVGRSATVSDKGLPEAGRP